MIKLSSIFSALFGTVLEFVVDKYDEYRARQREIEILELKLNNKNLEKGIKDARERRDFEHSLRLSTNDDISRRLRESREKIRELKNSRGR